MKKIFLLLALLLIPFSQGKAVAPATSQILQWADKEIAVLAEEVRTLNAQIKSTNENQDICIYEPEWKIFFSNRLGLGLSEAKKSIETMKQKNQCLIRDANEIDDRVGKIIRIASVTRNGCITTEQHAQRKVIFAYAQELMEKLIAIRKILQEEAWIPVKEEQKAQVIYDFEIQLMDIFWTNSIEGIPLELRGIHLHDLSYQSPEFCPEPVSYLSFYQAKSSFKNLLQKMEEVKQMGQDIGLTSKSYNSGKTPKELEEEKKRIDEIKKKKNNNIGDRFRGRIKAWIETNISYPSEGFNTRSVCGNFPTISERIDTKEKRRDCEQKIAEQKAPKLKSPGEALEEYNNLLLKNEVFLLVDESVREREEAIQIQLNDFATLSQSEGIDLVIQKKMENDILPLLKVIPETNNHLEAAIERLELVCTRMSNCPQ